MYIGIQGGKTAREKSAGAVIFRKEDGKTFYLLLHYHFKGDYWDFTRGKMEGTETEEETAVREIEEETGIKDIRFITGFRETTSWFYRWKDTDIFKEAVYFLAETDMKDVEISDEHLEHKWMQYEDAMSTLTFENTKEIMKAANDFLAKH